MEMLKTAGLIVLGAGLVAGVFAFIFVCLFKPEVSNMPNATRGVGLCALAGVLKIILLLLAGKVASWFGAPWLDYPLIALFVVGMVVMLTGLGEGPQ